MYVCVCVWYISEENVLISLKDYIERVHFIYAKYIYFWGEGGQHFFLRLIREVHHITPVLLWWFVNFSAKLRKSHKCREEERTLGSQCQQPNSCENKRALFFSSKQFNIQTKINTALTHRLLTTADIEV